MKYFFSLIMILSFSCKGQKHNLQEDSRLRLLVQDGYFPVEEPQVEVIEDMKGLRAFYSKVNQTRKPGLQIPEIDFTTQKVVIACLGKMNMMAMPMMYLKSENKEEMVLSVQLPDEKTDSKILSYPFCVYSISNEGKKVVVEMN